MSATTPSGDEEHFVATNTRSIQDYSDNDKSGVDFVDHFSLRKPSSTVRFRGARVHVYETATQQILLEDRQSPLDRNDDDNKNGKSRQQHRHNVTVKLVDWISFGLSALRFAYTLISFLIAGISFGICWQVILFLFLNLPVDAGLTTRDTDQDDIRIISTLLSVPVFLFGLSSLMAISTTFVADCWSGGHLIRAVLGLPVVLNELLFFTLFLLIPALTFIGALLAQQSNPWELTCYAWVITTGMTFCFFGLGIVWCEVSACFQLLSIHYSDDCSGSLLRQIHRAVILVQTQKYAGSKNEEYIISGNENPPRGGYSFSEHHQPIQIKRSLYTRLTSIGCLNCVWESLDPAKRMYSIEEVRDVLPFVTKYNWSLESMLCSSSRNRKIISTNLSPGQILTSFFCNIIGTALTILFFVGVLVWMHTGTKSYVLVVLIGLFGSLIPLVRSNYTMIKLYNDVNKDYSMDKDEEIFSNDLELREDVTNGEGIESVNIQLPNDKYHGEQQKDKTTMFRVWETTRISKPRIWVCYTGLFFEFAFLFFFPFVVLFKTGNYPIGCIFVVISVFSFLRKYFDAAAILCELGSMSNIDIETEPGKKSKALPFFEKLYILEGMNKTLVLKSRLGDIVGNISRSGSVVRWMYFFGFLVLLTFFMMLGAMSQDDGLGDRPPIVLVDDFYYPGEKTLQYPTCSMSKGFQLSGNSNNADTALGDYAMLSALAYEVPNVTGYLLPQWFGEEGAVVDEDALVSQYRKDSDTVADLSVYFKLFTFPSLPGTAVVAIRGSQTSWDWMVNMQLWSGSGLAQIVKWLTPYGWIWTPILDEFVWFLSFIQSASIKKVSYYTVTSDFVNSILDTYDGLRVTGASLGGGLAIITGAQTGAPSIAISGLGAEYARHSLNPPVSLEDINERVFNWIPDRDYIARLGGRPRQHQEAQCNATTSDLFGCHSMWRSVCEINYRCGTNGRPVICRCVYNFDFPAPLPIGNTTRSFDQACYEQEQAYLKATGSNLTSAWSKRANDRI